jgi:hypothetical protein
VPRLIRLLISAVFGLPIFTVPQQLHFPTRMRDLHGRDPVSVDASNHQCDASWMFNVASPNVASPLHSASWYDFKLSVPTHMICHLLSVIFQFLSSDIDNRIFGKMYCFVESALDINRHLISQIEYTKK